MKKSTTCIPNVHHETEIRIPGEPFVGTDMDFEGTEVPDLQDAPPPTNRERKFSRMFPDLPRFVPQRDAVIELGSLIESATGGGDHPTLPAGFTYLGQFIDHDITRDKTSNLDDDQANPDDIEQGRSPTTDLDSLYGLGPDQDPALYQSDKVRLRVGITTGTGVPAGDPVMAQPFPNDLPRRADGVAEIGDPRNDENLVVAQTHLAFIKFHNKVVDRLESNFDDQAELFEAARREVTLHYQSIILHDFLARIVDPAVLDDVLENGPKFFNPGSQFPTMPVEFAVAAYRLHAMVRPDYEWNRVFESGGPVGVNGRLGLLFEFTKVSGDLDGNPTLPTNWIIDWRRFYDFRDTAAASPNAEFNRTKLFKPHLSDPLKNLPEIIKQMDDAGVHRQSLGTRNLLRGRLLALPTGQDIARFMKAVISDIEVLTPAQVSDGPHEAILQKHGFDQKTPLWYYVLKEAQHHSGGLRLGKVGSRILVETFVALIAGSHHSILRGPGGWKPTLPSAEGNFYQMTDLLLLNDDLDPLG